MGEGNVISGNNKGILVSTAAKAPATNFIAGNLIGTNIAGTAAIGNNIGIEMNNTSSVVGGIDPGAMNIICGNTESGILVGLLSTGGYIQGNHIGVDKSGNIIMPNRDGIELGPGSYDYTVLNNLIKGNSQFGISCAGVMADSLDSAYHRIEGNEIYMNSIAGIGITNNSHDIVI